MKKFLFIIVLLAIVGGGYYWYTHRSVKQEVIHFRSQEIVRGNVTQEVTATGTVNPIKSVEVATQVTGKVISLTADYNTRVKEGDVIALIDPETYKSALESAEATLASNKASLERTRAQLVYAKKELDRTKKLFDRGMANESELDSCQANYDELVATEKSNLASIRQSEASVKTAQTNLSYCTITSPVTGIVIERSVDEGQTVVSSMSASALFKIATDMSRIQVEAAVPEADVGGIRVGQTVNFTVDAYRRQFTGKVTQIRLASTTTSNVVTYPVIVEADNPNEMLFPGMTANLSVIIDEAANTVVIPAAALRFEPPFPAPPEASEKKSEKKNTHTIWIADSSTEIHPADVELGISDGVNQSLNNADDLVGKKVVVGKQSAAAALAAEKSDTPSNPFMPKPPSRNGKNGKNGKGGAGGPPPPGP